MFIITTTITIITISAADRGRAHRLVLCTGPPSVAAIAVGGAGAAGGMVLVVET
jgi:hypothetical protein